jgi:hypothetical protein
MIRIANQTTFADGAIAEPLFQESCKTDTFKIFVVGSGAPHEGANSFTQSQAKDRVFSSGFAAPSTITKDEKGIWRGTTIRDGKSVSVAVDYKGNVVAQ